MHQLNEFCQKYIPQHFVSKYTNCKLKEHFFDYRNQGNVYELTGKNFSLIDKLLSANPQLQAAKIIDKYFIFKIVEFKKYRKEIAQEEESNHQARQAVRNILKSMDEVIFNLSQNNRMCFQLFVRISYLYFESRENHVNPQKKLTKKQFEEKKIKGEDYLDEILSTYMDIKFLTMTQDDSFNPSSFLEYCINKLLDFNPTKKFIERIDKILNECSISETHKSQIMEKIKNKKLYCEFTSNKSQHLLKKQSQTSNNSILEPKKENIPNENNVRPNESTPIKERSTSKSERKTHETSQKKLYVIQSQDKSSLETLKITLQNQMNKKIAHKERTLYSRKTYLMPKKASNINDQISSTGSNQNNNNDELFLIDFNKSFSSRCLNVHFDDDQDYLAGATPKPKKKVKIEKTFTGTFDENGHFRPGF